MSRFVQWIHAQRSDLLYKAPLLILAPIALLGLVIVILLIVRGGPKPPFTYTAWKYTPERAVYAPGDTLVYTASLRVDVEGDIDEIERGLREKVRSTNATGWRKPIAAYCYEHNCPMWLIRAAKMWTAPLATLCDGTTLRKPVDEYDPPAFPYEVVGNDVEGQIRIIIPNVRPGVYWITSAAKRSDTRQAVTEIEFEVNQPCGN